MLCGRFNFDIFYFNKYFYSCNRPSFAIIMSDTASLEQKFKVGVLKELHKRNLITRDELDRAIKIIGEKSA